MKPPNIHNLSRRQEDFYIRKRLHLFINLWWARLSKYITRFSCDVVQCDKMNEVVLPKNALKAPSMHDFFPTYNKCLHENWDAQWDQPDPWLRARSDPLSIQFDLFKGPGVELYTRPLFSIVSMTTIISSLIVSRLLTTTTHRIQLVFSTLLMTRFENVTARALLTGGTAFVPLTTPRKDSTSI